VNDHVVLVKGNLTALLELSENETPDDQASVFKRFAVDGQLLLRAATLARNFDVVAVCD